ncbi:Pyruvate,phosphate dikinase-domain-containing protein [Olavius algarvensis associated proteobacterium Delta 3]|nr:Pyruvate,phosphate dikinase-domain-containing protein [Olavius algarvensis associated proteobacterium Delta 3]
MIKSKALEVNIADYHVDVDVDPKYSVLQEAMSRYFGIMEGLTTFLKELSHPYKNWQFIVKEARNYSLNYFHLLKSHPKGETAAGLLVDIFAQAIDATSLSEVRVDAVDNLLLYLQRIIKDAGSEFDRFFRVLDHSFTRIANYPEPTFLLFVKSYYQLPALAEAFLGSAPEGFSSYESLNRMLVRYYRTTSEYWLSEDDPWEWFHTEASDIGSPENARPLFDDVSHGQIGRWQERQERASEEFPSGSPELTRKLMDLPHYNDVVNHYRELPHQLLKAGAATGKGNQWKVLFLFHIMNISGLSLIHEEALRDINRTLTWLFQNEKDWNTSKLLEKTFSILMVRTRKYPTTALNCVLNIGKGVYQTDEIDLINGFIDSVIELGFQHPNVGGVGDDWQIKVNNAHLSNIRTWMELIEINPKWSTRLLSSLIINLSLGGVFIKDTDLFPRDITRFLNSDISPVYNLTKQLMRLFPVYFNNIGAEGKLRDISTEIDEITHRKDVLIHFLRKQSHVESSNQVLAFIEATLNYWASRDNRCLRAYLPPIIYNQIGCDGPYVDGVHRVMQALSSGGIDLPQGLLNKTGEDLSLLLTDTAEDLAPADIRRALLATEFYKLLYQKYHIGFTEIANYIGQLKAEGFPYLDRLEQALAQPDLKKKLFMLLDFLDTLKNLILSPEEYEIREDIYKKRHFTVDIPSMYGSYHEMKFDALGLTFRVESLVNVLLEELIENIDLSLITKASIYQIYARLRLFDKALRLDGITSLEIGLQLDLLAHSLEVEGFTVTQYLDIFKGFAGAVRNIINDHFNNIHEENLSRILARTPVDQIKSKYLPRDSGIVDREKLQHRASEIFFRDQIAMSLGLQQMDLFLSRILKTLYHQAAKLPKDKLHRLLLYDPQNTMSRLDDAGSRMGGIIYLGNKGLNIMRLKNYGIRVPPGFIITTEVFRFLDIIESYAPAEQRLQEQVRRRITEIETQTGKVFGDPANPLLFSVRSGSTISQPGMMDTVLDVGMNEEIAAGLASRSGNPWFAWDNYRRFLQCYGMSFGLARDDFDAIMHDYKARWGKSFKKDFTGDQMQEVALAYKNLVKSAGHRIEEDPMAQLHLIIRKVFASWDSERAKAYRKIMSISEDWGTAVTIQSMVYGNLSENSGAGVVFTHNPRWSEDTLRLWGDFTIHNQGEDVVSGLVKTLPISLTQQSKEMRDTDITLETHFPKIYRALKNCANELIYEKGWSPQEMEFTFEGPSNRDLFMLQTRDMAMRERKQVLTFDLPAKTRLLSHGIGVSGGAMSGRVVFSLEEIDKWRSIEPNRPLILVRSDTVPDDIREIFAADGLLTARGGLTSHAAVVAHRLGKTCVVGCGDMICNEKEKIVQFHQIQLRSEAFISIDGQEGSVYHGLIPIHAG